MPTLSFNCDNHFVGDLRARFPSGTVASAMALLAESHLLAIDAACEASDFAVEIVELEQLGVSRSGLRWLLSRKLACHVHETTTSRSARRAFAAAPPAAPFTKKSCLVITEAGLRLLDREGGRMEGERFTTPTLAPSIALAVLRQAHGQSNGKVLSPLFDAVRCELSVSGQVVKRFRCPAPNQTRVLRAFQETSWPHRLDDPLPPGGDVSAKRRLHETIKALNARHHCKLLRFAGDGSGEGVLWEFVS